MLNGRVALTSHRFILYRLYYVHWCLMFDLIYSMLVKYRSNDSCCSRKKERILDDLIYVVSFFAYTSILGTFCPYYAIISVQQIIKSSFKNIALIIIVPIEMGSLFMKPRRHYLRFISGHHFEIKKLRINLCSSSHNPDFEGIDRPRLIKQMILI